MLKNSLLKQPSEEDPDEGIKDLVEITLKKMVTMYNLEFYIKIYRLVWDKANNSDYSNYQFPAWGHQTFGLCSFIIVLIVLVNFTI